MTVVWFRGQGVFQKLNKQFTIWLKMIEIDKKETVLFYLFWFAQN